MFKEDGNCFELYFPKSLLYGIKLFSLEKFELLLKKEQRIQFKEEQF